MKKPRLWLLIVFVFVGLASAGCYYWFVPPSEPFVIFPLNDSEGVATRVTLSWTKSEGTTPIVCDVYLDTDPNPSTPITPAAGIEATTVNSPVLLQNTTYYWKVIARNRGGRAVSNTWRFSTVVSGVPPSSPVPYSPGNGVTDLATPVALYWNPSSTGTAPIVYDVYLDTNPNPVTKIVNGTNLLTANYSNLLPNTVYYWKVVARNEHGSAQSAVWQFSTRVTGAGPSSPVNFLPTAGASQVSLNPVLIWQGSTGTTPIYYDVYLDTNTTPTTKIGNNLSLTNFTPSMLEAFTTYYWRVEARNAFGGPVSGAVTSFTTQATVTDPGTPTNLYPAQGVVGVPLQLYLLWQHSEGTQPIVYDVYFGDSASPTDLLGQNISQNYIPTPSLEPNTTYYWRVVAKSVLGNIAGVMTSFTTGGGSGIPPTNLTLLSPYNGQASVPLSTSLTWSCEGTAPITYHVWFGETPTLGSPGDYKGTTALASFTVSGLIQGRTYYWKIFATNAYGAGATSAVYSFTTSPSVGGPIYLEKLSSGNGFQVKSMNYFAPSAPFVMVFESTTLNASNLAMVPEFDQIETFGNYTVVLSLNTSEISTKLSAFSPSNLVLFTVISSTAGTIGLDTITSGSDIPIDPARQSVTLP